VRTAGRNAVDDLVCGAYHTIDKIFLINKTNESTVSTMSIFDNIILELALIFAGASMGDRIF
jgi:hypothetical protein